MFSVGHEPLSTAKNFARRVLYPGLDLHVRNRAALCTHWLSGARTVLDAGCGNGYFAWLAYRTGAKVRALSYDAAQIEKARRFLNGYLGIDPACLRFEQRNLYDLAGVAGPYDEIICYEVFEHLKRDADVAREFYRLLRPGGVLHLCCPFRLHPRHQVEVLDTKETGGHVRAGYTGDDYRALLEPLGFEIERLVGIGPRPLYLADAALRWIRNRWGDAFALPLLPLVLPFVWLAGNAPSVPFSLYCRAVRPPEAS